MFDFAVFFKNFKLQFEMFYMLKNIIKRTFAQHHSLALNILNLFLSRWSRCAVGHYLSLLFIWHSWRWTKTSLPSNLTILVQAPDWLQNLSAHLQSSAIDFSCTVYWVLELLLPSNTVRTLKCLRADKFKLTYLLWWKCSLICVIFSCGYLSFTVADMLLPLTFMYCAFNSLSWLDTSRLCSVVTLSILKGSQQINKCSI